MRQWSHTDLSQAARAPLALGAGFDRPACLRADRVDAVFFTGHDDRHLHQLRRRGDTWVHTDLSLLASAPPMPVETSPGACLRPDGVVSVVCTARGGHLHALELRGEAASHVDLTDAAGAPKASPSSSPTHFVRGDGLVAVVYASLPFQNSHVHQLTLRGDTWENADLSELTQSPGQVILKAAGYVRADRTTVVIYVGGSIRQLTQAPGGPWTAVDVAVPSAPRPDPRRWPMGYVRADGIAAVVYVDAGGFVHELALVAGRWVATALSEDAQAPRLTVDTVGGGAVGYVRGDRVTAVVYAGDDRRLHELALVDGRWTHTDLSAAGQTDTAGYPFPYVRSDGASSVVYTGQDRHVHELALPPA